MVLYWARVAVCSLLYCALWSRISVLYESIKACIYTLKHIYTHIYVCMHIYVYIQIYVYVYHMHVIYNIDIQIEVRKHSRERNPVLLSLNRRTDVSLSDIMEKFPFAWVHTLRVRFWCYNLRKKLSLLLEELDCSFCDMRYYLIWEKLSPVWTTQSENVQHVDVHVKLNCGLIFFCH